MNSSGSDVVFAFTSRSNINKPLYAIDSHYSFTLTPASTFTIVPLVIQGLTREMDMKPTVCFSIGQQSC